MSNVLVFSTTSGSRPLQFEGDACRYLLLRFVVCFSDWGPSSCLCTGSLASPISSTNKPLSLPPTLVGPLRLRPTSNCQMEISKVDRVRSHYQPVSRKREADMDDMAMKRGAATNVTNRQMQNKYVT